MTAVKKVYGSISIFDLYLQGDRSSPATIGITMNKPLSVQAACVDLMNHFFVWS